MRYKEFWGDRGAENDVLAIDGTDVINPTSAPSGAVGAASVSFFLFDVGSDGVSNLHGPIPFPFGTLAFLTGADLFIPTRSAGNARGRDGSARRLRRGAHRERARTCRRRRVGSSSS